MTHLQPAPVSLRHEGVSKRQVFEAEREGSQITDAVARLLLRSSTVQLQLCDRGPEVKVLSRFVSVRGQRLVDQVWVVWLLSQLPWRTADAMMPCDRSQVWVREVRWRRLEVQDRLQRQCLQGYPPDVCGQFTPGCVAYRCM